MKRFTKRQSWIGGGVLGVAAVSALAVVPFASAAVVSLPQFATGVYEVTAHTAGGDQSTRLCTALVFQNHPEGLQTAATENGFTGRFTNSPTSVDVNLNGAHWHFDLTAPYGPEVGASGTGSWDGNGASGTLSWRKTSAVDSSALCAKAEALGV